MSGMNMGNQLTLLLRKAIHNGVPIYPEHYYISNEKNGHEKL